jgi:hypothetical protein
VQSTRRILYSSATTHLPFAMLKMTSKYNTTLFQERIIISELVDTTSASICFFTTAWTPATAKTSRLWGANWSCRNFGLSCRSFTVIPRCRTTDVRCYVQPALQQQVTDECCSSDSKEHASQDQLRKEDRTHYVLLSLLQRRRLV